MAVFTPVINGRLGMGVLGMLLFIPPFPPKPSGIHHGAYTEISVQVPAPIMSGSEAAGPHHVPAYVLSNTAVRTELCKKVNSISESCVDTFHKNQTYWDVTINPFCIVSSPPLSNLCGAIIPYTEC